VGSVGELCEHRQRIIAMSADHEVRVIRENRACVHRVALLAYNFTKRFRDDLSLRIIESDRVEVEQGRSAPVEVAQLAA